MDEPPALSPVMSTCAGSAPKAAALARTQSSAACWSSRPTWAQAASGGAGAGTAGAMPSSARKPSAPSRYSTETMTAPVPCAMPEKSPCALPPTKPPPWIQTMSGAPGVAAAAGGTQTCTT